MTSRNAGTYTTTIGDFTVSAISDGMVTGSLEVVTGVDQETAAHTLQQNFRSLPPALSIQAFLVRHAGGLALVDAGSGSMMGPDCGRLVGNLATLGVAPADITTILVTHLHGDHIGGMTGANGEAVFPHAAIVLGATEHGFWTDETRPVPEPLKPGKDLAALTLAAYQGRVQTVTDDQEGLPGIRLVELPGHTPGHAGWMLASGAESLLIWGDIVHLPGLQFARPDATMIYDLDPTQAEASRRRAFDMASTDRLHIAGMHLDFPAFGHVERRPEGYGFVADVWRF